jgi:hypothetical protein
MGYDAACTLRLDGTSSRGIARLEHTDLVFRGGVRLAIPLADITAATAEDGVLRVRFGGREAEFAIGAAAPKWAARITSPPSRLDKLGIKAGLRVAADSVPDPSFAAELEQRGAVLVPLRSPETAALDLIFHPAPDRAALDRLSALKRRIQPDGAIWVVRPKGSKAISEAETMAAGKRAGLVDVKVVSFSAAYTAEKFVIPVAERPARGQRSASPQPRAQGRARTATPSRAQRGASARAPVSNRRRRR